MVLSTREIENQLRIDLNNRKEQGHYIKFEAALVALGFSEKDLDDMAKVINKIDIHTSIKDFDELKTKVTNEKVLSFMNDISAGYAEAARKITDGPAWSHPSRPNVAVIKRSLEVATIGKALELIKAQKLAPEQSAHQKQR